MHVVGMRFEDHGSAAAALVEIRDRVPVAPGDIAVRPLGSTRYESPAGGFLLGGRFADADVPAVIQVAEARGGVLVERRLEWPHVNPAPETRTPRLASGHARSSERRITRPHAPSTRPKRLRRPAAGMRRTARDRRCSGG